MTDIMERLKSTAETLALTAMNGRDTRHIKLLETAAHEITRLRAELEQSGRTIDLLERNARIQAKLLADTGRELEANPSSTPRSATCEWPNCDQPGGGDYCYETCLVAPTEGGRG